MLARPTIAVAAPGGEEERLDVLIRAEYERCHPEDTFEDLKRRARFSKEDRYLLRDWRVVAGRLVRDRGETRRGSLARAA